MFNCLIVWAKLYFYKVKGCSKVYIFDPIQYLIFIN